MSFKFDIYELVRIRRGRQLGQFGVIKNRWRNSDDTNAYELRMVNDHATEYFLERDLDQKDPACPVCSSKIAVKNNLIAEHNFNSKICYGSFMPVGWF